MLSCFRLGIRTVSTYSTNLAEVVLACLLLSTYNSHCIDALASIKAIIYTSPLNPVILNGPFKSTAM